MFNNINVPKPTNLSLDVKENDLYILWDPVTSLTKVRFSQNFPLQNEKEFIVSNDKGILKVPYSEFKNFSKTTTVIEISHAISSGISAFERTSDFSVPFAKSINVTEHLFQ